MVNFEKEKVKRRANVGKMHPFSLIPISHMTLELEWGVGNAVRRWHVEKFQVDVIGLGIFLLRVLLFYKYFYFLVFSFHFSIKV